MALLMKGVYAFMQAFQSGSQLNRSAFTPMFFLLRALSTLFNAIETIMHRVRNAWVRAQSNVQDITRILGDLARWQTDNWTRLLTVILPESLKALRDNIHTWAVRTFLPKSWLRSREWLDTRNHTATVYRWYQANHTWLSTFRRTTWPNLKHWQTRRAEPQLRQLWRLNPRHRALQPIITHNVFKFLLSRSGHTTLHKLTIRVVDESPTIWQHVDRAILRYLRTEVNPAHMRR